jgi:hypothetical protein
MERSKLPREELHAEPAKHLTLEQRMGLFLALVEAQEGAMTVPQSRRDVAERFGVSEARELAIEREVIDGDCAPLGESPSDWPS